MKTFKLVIVGGGSTYTPGIVKSLLSRKEEFKISELRLYDTNEERQNKVGVIVRKVVEMFDLDVKLIFTTNPEEAFKDADFVFAQMRVGLYKMRELDEKIPLKYNVIGQETCGPGGLAYGLRTIYPMAQMIDYCEEYASPNYWIVNYSNPAAIVAKAMYKLRPNARILNICDMPVAIMRNMANILDCDRHEIEADYFGLNHFGWYTKIRVNGEDKTEELKAYVAEHGYIPPDSRSEVRHNDASWIHTFENAKHIMNMFPNYLPNTYMQYYFLGDKIVEESDKNHTRANEVMEGREKKIFAAVDNYNITGEIDLTQFFTGVHGEFIVEVAMSLAYDLRKRHLVMVENKGAIKNLPDDAMVEIPAYITKDGPEPVRVGEIPTFYKGLIEQQEASEKLVVEAAIEGSYEKALMAFTMNKTIPSAFVAKQILDDMIEANKDYWPKLK
ncbi:6-phospho-alpha-glucosidase [Clostridium tagluense]|uniref:6-phospho-alpha-glucosidase n=1 Tax=Clostridium tagluense TaxID=360422 RepID=UPI001C6E6812|nr:6-phospho-alpha-glucosidase [Clostridium tagluense]MBW9158181.1 6-phospho-alpha-glucosidase [Clostridium tagluense]WLC67503.1 6-phospho-alpha-glucosidase [Clostridium tagluense]